MAATPTWVLRTSVDRKNPTVPTLYGLGTTFGRLVVWRNDGTNTYFLIFICDGGLYGCDGLDDFLYNGDAGNIDAYQFHPGTLTKQVSPKIFTADNTTDVITSNAHGYADTNQVRVKSTDGALPAPLNTTTKYFVRDATVNTFKLTLTSGGTAINITDNGTGTLRVWKADAGFDDPVQGRPTYFPTIDETFSGICYVEGKLNSAVSADEEPSGSFQIYVRGRKLQDYDDAGVPVGVPAFSANNALVAADLLLNTFKVSTSRIDWPSWDYYKSQCDKLIFYSYADDGSAPGIGLSARYYNGDNFQTLVLTRIDATINVAPTSVSPGPGVNNTPPNSITVRWTGKIKPQYNETYTIYFTIDNGVKVWVNSNLLIDSFVNLPPRTLSQTIALTANTLFDITVETVNYGGSPYEWAIEWQSASQARQVIPTTRLYPSDTEVTRYEAHLAFASPTEAPEVLDRVLERSPGWHWTDRDGRIEFVDPERLVEFEFVFDPNDDDITGTVIEKTFSKKQIRSAKKRFMRLFSYRDLDKQDFVESFVESRSLLAEAKRQPNNGIDNDEPVELGVTTMSLAQRMADLQMLLQNDPAFFYTLLGGRASSALYKNALVDIRCYMPENNQIAEGRCLVTGIQRGGNTNGNCGVSLLPVVRYPFYADAPVDEGEGIWATFEGEIIGTDDGDRVLVEG